MRRRATLILFALTVAVVMTGSLTAQQDAQSELDQMRNQMEESPLVEPSQRPVDRAPVDETLFQPDARVIGVPPDAAPPKLRREGEFVLNRRGRLLRSTGTAMAYLFVFEADDEGKPEPPMFILPCQRLESMESLVREQGDKVLFELSGQVFTYRGANYLMPTMMKLAIDRGNLQP